MNALNHLRISLQRWVTHAILTGIDRLQNEDGKKAWIILAIAILAIAWELFYLHEYNVIIFVLGITILFVITDKLTK